MSLAKPVTPVRIGSALVTGATGFVGTALCRRLAEEGVNVVAAIRQAAENSAADFNCSPDSGSPVPEQGKQAGYSGTLPSFRPVVVGNIDAHTDWSPALAGVEVVFHLAARAHVLRETAADPLAEFRRTNVAGTERLARSAAAAGVRRLVYVSSVGVNGLYTREGRKFSEADVPQPHNDYALSKWEAEQALHRIGAETGLQVVIVRPPLVYGPAAPGNFAQLLAVVANGIPLPFASVRNQRSLVYVGNLVDALITCASHPAAAGKTYLVSDGEDVSTAELMRRLAGALGVPARLFPCPPALLLLAGRLTGRHEQVERLLGSLQVDSDKIRRELGWMPPCTLQQGLAEAVKADG